MHSSTAHHPQGVPQRIVVVGCSGSGKTTTARHIAKLLHIPHVELDALHWEPNWTEAPLDVFQARITKALSGDRWVVDGNYSKVRDLVWSRADTIVWLDYPLGLVMWQLLKRTLQRSWRQEVLWNGNRENWQLSFFSRDSILLWALRTFRKHRRTYAALSQDPIFAHLKFVRLRSPQNTRDWLTKFCSATNPND
ncbi:adenylate kinase [Oscillatoria sp. FACHB-1407]|uniref:adenylate kinase n=1 Tax=Oscillatoria sp. FACHB-1407 TaxID=2692847 RepID=UPI001683D295|nr:adenylate kinase [Oscillatoria sp. FACHB-1407]MBD2463342.1 adenylate kinase [Oscillatoria sp. FACHB-1407]